MHGERWLENLGEAGSGGGTASASGAGGGRSSFDERSAPRGRPGRQLDYAWQAHLGELQCTAERLARGHGIRLLGQMGVEELKQQHPDYEFFNTRG